METSKLKSDCLCLKGASVIKYKLLGLVSGSIMVGLPLALIGSFSNHVILAGICGAVIGAFAGFYAVEGQVSSIVAGMVLLAVENTAFGAGCDDFTGGSSIIGAIIGACIGYLGWPWVIGIFGLFIGLFCGMVLSDFYGAVPGGYLSPGFFQLYGMVSGGILSTIASYLVYWRIKRSRINKEVPTDDKVA
jgi:hypothetical protein